MVKSMRRKFFLIWILAPPSFPSSSPLTTEKLNQRVRKACGQHLMCEGLQHEEEFEQNYLHLLFHLLSLLHLHKYHWQKRRQWAISPTSSSSLQPAHAVMAFMIYFIPTPAFHWLLRKEVGKKIYVCKCCCILSS
uniref:Uncharacterized protein n=1 Tax=Sphaerodactylus townsendi TaxID=933632 RepID=A0ACB8G4X7_9SAUR